MMEERERNEQAELNAQFRKHMSFMKQAGWYGRYSLAILLVMFGGIILVESKLVFGDVLVLLGVMWLVKLFKTL